MLINELLCHIGIEVGRLDEAQKEFVDNLQVRPSQLQDRLILFGVKCIASRIYLRGNGPEKIGAKLEDMCEIASSSSQETETLTMATTSG
jgi:hypothetical protein